MKIARVFIIALVLFPMFAAAPALAASISLSPASGPPSTQVTVGGSAFTPGSDYTVTFDGNQVATGTVSAGGNISAPFFIGAAIRGGHVITVATDPDGSFSATFTVTPQLILGRLTANVGDLIDLKGAGFNPGTVVTVYFDDRTVTSIPTNADGTFTNYSFNVPETYQGVHTVKGADNIGETFGIAFTVEPKIALSPVTAGAGGQISVSGTGFAAGSGITFLINNEDMTAAPVTTSASGSFSDASITVPALARGSHTLRARDGAGNQASASFTLAPSITLNPSSGAPGAAVEVSGSGFNPNEIMSITWGGASIVTSPTSVSANHLGQFSAAFIVPIGAAGSYTVSASDGSNLAEAVFSVVTGAEIEPASGPAGTQVTIKGSGFSPGGTVRVTYDGIQVASGTADSGGAFSISFDAPLSPSGSHVVAASDGVNGVTTSFTIRPTAGISPAAGGVDENLNVSGTGFLAGRAVNLTYDLAPVASVTTDDRGSFNAAFQAPASASGAHNVAASDGVNSITLVYTVRSSARLTPGSGTVGTDITVNGAGFTAGGTAVITYDNLQVASAPIDSRGSFNSGFKAPGSSSGARVVAITDGANTAALSFRVMPALSLTPESGHVGSLVGVSGAGFAALANIAVTYNNAQVTNAFTDATGTFTAVFQVPPSPGGPHPVAATDGASTASASFAMDTAPPAAPEPRSPPDVTQAADTPSFTWGPVTDPSGVTFTLQIASDAGFSNIVLEKAGITSLGYRLTGDEKLESTGQDAPYYWRVRAVDGAANTGDWSAPRSFYVGFSLPGWVLYVIAGIAVVLAGLLGFWLGRRSAAA